MLSNSQKSRLELRGGIKRTDSIDGHPTQICSWISDSELSYNAQWISFGAELAAAEDGARVTQVNGFGAVQNVPRDRTGGVPACQFAVDAAPDRTIRVQVLGSYSASSPKEEELCQIAQKATAQVMTTVVSMQRR